MTGRSPWTRVDANVLRRRLLPTFIDLEKLTTRDIALMMLIMLPVMGGILTGYPHAAAQARRFLNY